MRSRRSTVRWIGLAAAVVALLGSGQVTEAGLRRMVRAAWELVTEPGDSGPRRSRPPRGDTAPLAGQARIIDGDTMDIGDTRIRMRGIDALEHDQRCSARGRGSYDCGKLARDALVGLIGGAEVTCTPDGTETYGRIVATCTVPGQGGRGTVDLNAAMVRTGLAFDCTRYSDGAYAGAERAAKAAGSGAWAGRFDFPWQHRDRANACGRD
jgi:endonuclease YncB( thermonuclease family)